MARALLAYHTCTLSYLPMLTLITTLLGVYHRQARTIGGATLHHASMSHHKYMTWASMMIYRIRAHEQWHHTCMTEAERLYVQGNLLRHVPVYPSFVCKTDSLPP